MDIKSFVKEFESVKDKTAFIRKHLKTRYVDYGTKISLCKSIIRQSMYKDINGKKMFVIDSPSRYLFFVLTIVSTYVDIEMPIDGVKRMQLIDEIEKYDLMDSISEALGNEYTKFNALLSVMVEDEINNNDLRSMLETKLETLSLISNQIPWEKIINHENNSDNKS